MAAGKLDRDIALSDILGELRQSHAELAATLSAAVVTRSDLDARVLTSIAAGAATRLGEKLTTLRELLLNHK